ncbi:hypothetical protein C8Q77DRAFT_1132828 [Trametes polyzona]|nr:hypothetical protein C8Q77DRAFT_1132828 [Trametes polyzona]
MKHLAILLSSSHVVVVIAVVVDWFRSGSSRCRSAWARVGMVGCLFKAHSLAARHGARLLSVLSYSFPLGVVYTAVSVLLFFLS